MNGRILISGASIAGRTLAHWLARYGFQPIVVERAGRLRQGGNGVDVRGMAGEVVELMGIMTQVRAAATDVVGMKFVDARYRAVARIDTRDRSGMEIMRGDLVALLRRETDVEYVFGDSAHALRQDEDGVTVDFEQGGRRRFDLVIGADGMHSTTARLRSRSGLCGVQGSLLRLRRRGRRARREPLRDDVQHAGQDGRALSVTRTWWRAGSRSGRTSG